MTWLYLLLIAHAINAIVFILAKYFVSGPIPDVRVYVFYESLGSLAYLILIPFGVTLLPLPYLILNIGAGFIFSIALLFLYSAIKRRDVSGVAPAIGAMTAIFTLGLSVLFLNSVFSATDIWAFVLLVLGTFAVSKFNIESYAAGKRSLKQLSSAIAASALLALFYVTIKMSYNEFGFLDPFFWTRVGMIAGAGFILVFLNKDKVLFSAFKQSTSSLKFGFIGTKMLAGLAFLLIAVAAYLGDVALVNAMQGLQYVFLIIISFVLIKTHPRIIKEHYQSHSWLQKFFAIILVVGGLILLGLGGR